MVHVTGVAHGEGFVLGGVLGGTGSVGDLCEGEALWEEVEEDHWDGVEEDQGGGDQGDHGGGVGGGGGIGC